ncbi:MAG: glycosyl hydrolase family 28 protein [Rikenellaceae bacterium]
MKRLLLLTLALFSLCVAEARIYDIAELGAKNDGVTNNTQIIQQAIDNCSAAGGGTVLLTGGGSYMCGTIYLKSFVTIQVDNGTTLLASPNIKDYGTDTHKIMYIDETSKDRCFIYADGAESIALVGHGTINGNGSEKNFSRKGYRPLLMRLKDCDKITITDLTLRDPAAWTTAFLYCNDISIRGIRISSRVNFNGDGLDFDGCTNVRVSDSDFDNSDDCICLQTSRDDKPCRNVVVTNCTFKTKWAGIRIGLLSRGEISSVTVTNCTFNDIDDSGLKIQQNEGGCMSDMVFSNLVMKNVPRPIFMTFCKQRACVDMPKEPLDELQYMKRFSFTNFIVNNEELDKNSVIMISGIPGYRIEDIYMNNIFFKVSGGGTKEDASRKDVPEFVAPAMKRWPEFYVLDGAAPAYGLYLRHIDGIDISDVKIELSGDDARPMMKCDDVLNMTKRNIVTKRK